MSIDELLIEATTTGDDAEHASQQQRAVAPFPSYNHRARHRSQSPTRGRPPYHLAVSQPHSQHASRSRGSSVVPAPQQLHPSASISGPGVSPSGSGGRSPVPPVQPGSVQAIQTHIFAPPVTGAPVKKSKGNGAQGTAPAVPNNNGSVLTLGMDPN